MNEPTAAPAPRSKRPAGITALFIFLCIGTAGLVVAALRSPADLMFYAIVVPLYAGLTVGIFRGWNSARIGLIVVLSLLLAIAAWSMVGLYSGSQPAIDSLDVDAGRTLTLQYGVRIVLFPLVIAYLCKQNVRAFFTADADTSPPDQA